MLLWINGTFGVGKTQTAFELHRRLPGSVVVDPEQIGYALRRISPRTIWPDDFQELSQWRTAVQMHLQWIADRFDGVVIVPMTLLDIGWHEQIVGGLRAAAVPLAHFTLTAAPAVVRARLAHRGDRGNTWALRKLERYLPALNDAQFAEHVATDQLSIARTAEHIAARAGLSLSPAAHPALARWRRLRVWVAHIRMSG